MKATLVDAVIVEPWTVLLIELFDVLAIPTAKEVKQCGSFNGIALLDPQSGFLNVAEQFLMCRAVLFETWKSISFEQLFFADEVHSRELEKAIQVVVELFTGAAAYEGRVELIDGIHEDAVLIVHRLNANRTRVTPSQKGHNASGNCY